MYLIRVFPCMFAILGVLLWIKVCTLQSIISSLRQVFMWRVRWKHLSLKQMSFASTFCWIKVQTHIFWSRQTLHCITWLSVWTVCRPLYWRHLSAMKEHDANSNFQIIILIFFFWWVSLLSYLQKLYWLWGLSLCTFIAVFALNVTKAILLYLYAKNNIS